MSVTEFFLIILLLIIVVGAGLLMYGSARSSQVLKKPRNHYRPPVTTINPLPDDWSPPNTLNENEAHPPQIEWGNVENDNNMSNHIVWGEVQELAEIDPIPDRNINEPEQICPICRANIDDNISEIYTCPGCNTHFHQNCWVEEMSQLCPVCRDE